MQSFVLPSGPEKRGRSKTFRRNLISPGSPPTVGTKIAKRKSTPFTVYWNEFDKIFKKNSNLFLRDTEILHFPCEATFVGKIRRSSNFPIRKSIQNDNFLEEIKITAGRRGESGLGEGKS